MTDHQPQERPQSQKNVSLPRSSCTHFDFYKSNASVLSRFREHVKLSRLRLSSNISQLRDFEQEAPIGSADPQQ
jgi:hypothetical protein